MSAARSSSSSARRSAAGECTESIASASFGPDAGGADQRLERVALVARREAVEHHRVLAHVQVREQERGVARVQRGQRAERARGRGSRRPRPRRAPRRSAVRSSTVPRTEPIIGRPPPSATRGGDRARRADVGRAPRLAPPAAASGARHQWHSASASASAASGGSGTSAQLQEPGHHRLHLVLARAAVAGDRELHLVGAVVHDRHAGAPGEREREPARLARPTSRCGCSPGTAPARPPPPPGGSSTISASSSRSSVAEPRRAARRPAACGSRRRRRPGTAAAVAAHRAVPAARHAGVDAQDQLVAPPSGRIEHEFDPRGVSSASWRMPAALLALAALEDRADARRTTTSPATIGHDPLPHRAAGRVHQVDGLGLLASRSCADPRRRRRSTRAGVGRARRCRVGRAVGAASGLGASARRRVSTSRLRLSANWPSSLLDTSAITPRPNCATLPVMLRSVSMLHGGAVAVGDERGGDGGRRVALAARVATLGLEHHLVVGLVGLVDLGHALVLRGDRADLDLHRAAVLVALDLGELRARAGTGRCARGRGAPSTPRRRARRPGNCLRSSLVLLLQSFEIVEGVDVGRAPGVGAVDSSRRRGRCISARAPDVAAELHAPRARGYAPA